MAYVSGTVSVKDASGKELFTSAVKAGAKVKVPLTLAKGENAYTVTVTPDKEYVVSETEELSSFDSLTVEHTVSFAVDGRDTIYVSPSGKADAKGTAEDPASLKSPAPGTTIYLLPGTYKVTGTIVIEHGINGTEAEPIRLMAAPGCETRPVIDFGGTGEGLRVSGDWWYLYGFDVTNSGKNGVHVAGNHITLERVNAYRNGNTGIQISLPHLQRSRVRHFHFLPCSPAQQRSFA